MAGPIKPDEVAAARKLPEFVFEAFNELIARNWTGRVAKVMQDDAVQAILVKSPDATRAQVFEEGWLNVEGHYRAAGWSVEYDKPGYNESYKAFFIFKKKGAK